MKPAKANLVGIIDARVAGVSGDKFLGALVDLGAREARLKKVGKVVEESLPGVRNIKVDVRSVERGEIRAKLVTVESNEGVSKRKARVLQSSTEKAAQTLNLSEWGRKFALSTIDTLVRAESHVHGHAPENIELHELGSADTLVDILGVAYLAEGLGLGGLDWWSTSLAVGVGTSHFADMAYPNPPPAVAEILRAHKFPIQTGQVSQELTTPTGAAITANLARHASDSYPPFRPDSIGYGAGSKELREVSNVLRLLVGERADFAHGHDEVVILETNLDDVSGEVVGRAVEELIAAGARDVSITPIFMKKNRPGHLISVITTEQEAERLAQLLIQQTGTFGVRELPVTRHITPRTIRSVLLRIKSRKYSVRIKSALDLKGRVTREKIEYEDLRRISTETGLSVRRLSELVEAQLRTKSK